MWNYCSPIKSEDLKKFEAAFGFTINPALREFLLTHNAGRTRQHSIPTIIKDRKIASILDFSEYGNAWDINRRMRKILGSKCIVIGTDKSDNFLCVCRNMKKQEFAIWNHVTGAIEECTMDIPMLLMHWQAGTNGSAALGS